jgi:hypothetical protein
MAIQKNIEITGMKFVIEYKLPNSTGTGKWSIQVDEECWPELCRFFQNLPDYKPLIVRIPKQKSKKKK